MSEDVAIAQIVTAIITVFYAVVFAIGCHLLIKANRETLRKMREQRISGGRPQVTIEAHSGQLLLLAAPPAVVRRGPETPSTRRRKSPR